MSSPNPPSTINRVFQSSFGHTFTRSRLIILNPGSSQRHSAPQLPPEKRSDIIKPLKVSLKKLYSGTVKRLKVGRRLLDGTTEDKALEVQIHPGWKISLRDLEGVGVSDFSSRSPLVHMNPGWKSGTKIHFARAGNEQHGGEVQDLVFVVEEKSDDVFSREGNDLYCRVRFSLVEALAGREGGHDSRVAGWTEDAGGGTVGCDQTWSGADDLWRGNPDKEGLWECEEEGRHEWQVGSGIS